MTGVHVGLGKVYSFNAETALNRGLKLWGLARLGFLCPSLAVFFLSACSNTDINDKPVNDDYVSFCSKNTDSLSSTSKSVLRTRALFETGIIGGRELESYDKLSKSTAMVFIDLGERFNSCTGSLIAPDVILTAAHCVVRQTAANVKIYFNTNPLCDYEKGRVVSRDVEDFEFPVQYQEGTAHYDIALIRMKQEAPSFMRPIKMLLEPVHLGSQPVTVVGYGKTQDNPDSRKNTRQVLKATEVKAWENVGSQEYKDEIYYFDQSGGTGICSGDSGGPAITTKDNKNYVFAVAATVISKNKNRSSCLYASKFMSLYYHRDWINKTLNSWQ